MNFKLTVGGSDYTKTYDEIVLYISDAGTGLTDAEFWSVYKLKNTNYKNDVAESIFQKICEGKNIVFGLLETSLASDTIDAVTLGETVGDLYNFTYDGDPTPTSVKATFISQIESLLSDTEFKDWTLAYVKTLASIKDEISKYLVGKAINGYSVNNTGMTNTAFTITLLT